MTLQRGLVWIAVALFVVYALMDTSIVDPWHQQFLVGAGFACFAGGHL